MIYGAVGKAVGIATVVFGVSIIPTDRLLPITTTNLYDWFILIGVLIVYITCLFKLAHFIDNKLTAYLRKKRELKDDELKSTEKITDRHDNWWT